MIKSTFTMTMRKTLKPPRKSDANLTRCKMNLAIAIISIMLVVAIGLGTLEVLLDE